MEKNKFDRILDIVRSGINLREEPVNNIGSGNIAGSVEAGDDPPVRLKKNKKYIYMRGVRKMWKPDNG
jgi:hypothetical protein